MKRNHPREIRKKVMPEEYLRILCGNKTFDLRKDEDDVQVNDTMIYLEWDGERFTGRNIQCKVTDVQRGQEREGIAEGYCIIQYKPKGPRHVLKRKRSAFYSESMPIRTVLCFSDLTLEDRERWLKHCFTDALIWYVHAVLEAKVIYNLTMRQPIRTPKEYFESGADEEERHRVAVAIVKLVNEPNSENKKEYLESISYFLPPYKRFAGVPAEKSDYRNEVES